MMNNRHLMQLCLFVLAIGLTLPATGCDDSSSNSAGRRRPKRTKSKVRAVRAETDKNSLTLKTSPKN